MLRSTNKKTGKNSGRPIFFWKTEIGAKHKSNAEGGRRSSPRDARRIGPLECSLDKSTKGRV
jgi:hypothetical protein